MQVSHAPSWGEAGLGEGLLEICRPATPLIGWGSPLGGRAGRGEEPVVLVSGCFGHSAVLVAGLSLYRIPYF